MTDYQVVDLGGMEVTETTPVVAGPRGANGTDGASAYEVAVANGFVGTEAEWLASLEGGGAVSSVNALTGDVVLDAAAVHARPDTYVPSWDEVTGKPSIPDSADDIGAETPAGAQAKVDAHAADTTAVHGIADTSLLATTADVSAASTADRARGNHTGTQTSATISDFTEAVQDAVAALLTSGSNVTLTYNDAGNSLTVTAAGGDAETMRDTIGAALAGVGNIAVTVNDAADTITISTTATVNSTDAALRDRSTHTGTQSADTLTDGTTNKAFLATERTKLAGVAAGATANDTDANLKNRANHTGTQAASTITGLGDAAAKNTGTTAGTVAAGDDSRITGAAQKSANLSDLGSASTARTNLGLGTAATANTGTGSTNVILGNDTRLTDARTPTTHTHGLADLTATGTKDATTFLRGDNTWAVPAGGGGGTWSAYTPTLTNFAGTVNEARYTQTGKTVTFVVVVTLSGAPTGQLIVSAPVVARTSSVERICGSAAAHDILTAFYTGVCRIESGASPRFVVHSHSATNYWTPSLPFTWGSGDIFQITGTYEAA